MKDHVSFEFIGTRIMILVLILFTILLIGVKRGHSEYYRYVDQNGAVRYTDDLLEVPAAQRDDAKKIIGIQATSSGEESVDPSLEGDTKKESGDADQNESKKTEYERLTQKKEMLDKEYDALQSERDALLKAKETLKIKDYNEKVRQLNQHIATYEEKRKAFQKVADAYNVQIKE